jgi:hypothetical protein
MSHLHGAEHVGGVGWTPDPGTHPPLSSRGIPIHNFLPKTENM